jgi:glyoxylase-like metal-dependent hydrolase (beta-lactamase superfamily II)
MNPLELSTVVIDSGVVTESVNRITNEITELREGLAIVESFSHCVVLDVGDGLMCFDASGPGSGQGVVEAIRTWSNKPITTLVYTHGHADHVGGSVAFKKDAEARGEKRPHVIAHENVAKRLDRYEETNLWNVAINKRQFGGIRSDMSVEITEGAERFLSRSTLVPDETFTDQLTLNAGGTTIELHHARGETDDHLWAWLPEKKWIFTGDFIIWNYPNAGNPQKVQRYALEWAQALRKMIDQGPELLVPAHGLPIEGKERIARVLDDIASSLESLVTEVVAMMNAGETLDTIIHKVKVPSEVLEKPYLRPLYDEPEFVVRNIWRLNGGWWDGVASHLKPAPNADLGAEIASLAGGPDVLMRRAMELLDSDIRLACHLADLAGWAAPDDPAIHADREAVYEQRRNVEKSLMSKGIFKAAARESREVVKKAQ